MKLFHQGRFLDPQRVGPIWHEALVVGVDGRILAAGSESDMRSIAGAAAERVSVGGAVVLPGFNDAHVHLWKVGNLLTSMLDVRGVGSMGELTARIAEFAGPLPEGRWFQGRGYNEATLREGRHPTRADLDAALGERPGYLIRTCAHIAVANTAALRLAGVTRDTLPPPGGVIEKDAHGEPTGVLHETALGLVANRIPPPSRAQYEEMILAGCRHQLSLGITSATDPAVFPELLDAYDHLAATGRLPQRVSLLFIRRPDGGTETYPLPKQIYSDFLRLDAVKFFADGGLSGATAALSRPYQNAPGAGVLRFETDDLAALAEEAATAGFGIGTHAIGDRAIEQVLSVYERIWSRHPNARLRIEHLGLPSAEHLVRLKRCGIIAVPQAIFLDELGPNFRRYLDSDFLDRSYPIRSMLDAGLTVALSSDAPVVRNDNPLSGIRAAVTRRDREGELIAGQESISVLEAFHAYTRGAAAACGDGADRGGLEPGMRADLVALSGDPLTTPAEQMDALRVEKVWVGGVPAA